MLMRLTTLFFFLFLMLEGVKLHGQDSNQVKKDSIQLKKLTPIKKVKTMVSDSAAVARQHISDSLALIYVSRPDPDRENMFIVQKLATLKNRAYIFFDDKQGNTGKSFRQAGDTHPKRDPRVMVIVMALLVYCAFIGRLLHKEILEIIQSIYSKRIFMQISKEYSLLNATSFMLLYSLFGFTFGLFLYQLSGYYGAHYTISGFQLFFAFSLIVFILFAIKILVLRALGFIFAIQKLVQEYISVLYLSYFNLAFVFLIVVFCFSMLSVRFVPLLLLLATGFISVIFVFQYLRSSLNVISSFRFRKVYLIIYLCALEICPILILIKALKF